MTYKVVVSDTRHADYSVERDVLETIGAQLMLADCVTEDDVIRECADADAILLDMAPMTANAIAKLKRCKVINRYGVGYDNLDVSACTAHGIWATYVPDYCMEDVSDLALALLLTCLRSTSLRDRLVREGKWNIQSDHSFRLRGKVLGLLGGGRIARTLIGKVSGFGFSKILVFDPYVSAEEFSAIGAQKAELDEVLRNSDFLSLHMPVTPETRGMINKDTLAKMKRSAILINTARGPLIRDEDLIHALQSGVITCAGLDTHNKEPLPKNSPYFALDNVILSDHTAYSTKEGVIELKTKSAWNVADALMGKKPKYSINNL